jgi:hypothetical protein
MVMPVIIVVAATDTGRDEPAVGGFGGGLFIEHKDRQRGVGGEVVFSGALQEAKHGLAGFGLDAGFGVLRQDDAASVKELDSGGSGIGRNYISGGDGPGGDGGYRDAGAVQIEWLGARDGAYGGRGPAHREAANRERTTAFNMGECSFLRESKKNGHG